jgi:hypothetical protein
VLRIKDVREFAARLTGAVHDEFSDVDEIAAKLIAAPEASIRHGICCRPGIQSIRH